jgi:glutamine cyclotransferase
MQERKLTKQLLSLLIVVSLAIVILSLRNDLKKEPIAAIYTYRVINNYPHDKEAFTQGLVFDNDFIYEGTGLYGRSSIRQTRLETGEIIRQHNLSSSYFGEGITIYQDKIFQITWKSHQGFIYNKSNLKPLDTFEIKTEGWGLTHNGTTLVLSDGTAFLYFLDLTTFEEVKVLEVIDQNIPIKQLNELEYVNGKIYANVWHSEKIAMINPKTGQVSGWIDLAGLQDYLEDNTSIGELNGIAFDTENERLFVTGKLWPQVFEIEIIKKN